MALEKFKKYKLVMRDTPVKEVVLTGPVEISEKDPAYCEFACRPQDKEETGIIAYYIRDGNYKLNNNFLEVINTHEPYLIIKLVQPEALRVSTHGELELALIKAEEKA